MWWQFTIASQKGIVLKCWNALTSTWKVVPHTHPYVHTLASLHLFLPPSLMERSSSFNLKLIPLEILALTPKIHFLRDQTSSITSPSVLHLQPSSSPLAASIPEAVKLIYLSLVLKKKKRFSLDPHPFPAVILSLSPSKPMI